jgi:hypothetical protein
VKFHPALQRGALRRGKRRVNWLQGGKVVSHGAGGYTTPIRGQLAMLSAEVHIRARQATEAKSGRVPTFRSFGPRQLRRPPSWCICGRPELVRRLAATTAELVLVEAPAGFGKTTLVAQWRSALIERRTFAWLSLDRDDDDPARLWWHIVCSLQRACPDLDGQDMLDELPRSSMCR